MSEEAENTVVRRKGGRPSNAQKAAATAASFKDSPEFREAVAVATAEASARVRDEVLSLLKAGAVSTENVDAGSAGMFRQMALAIAEISDQGTSRKRVAPEVMEQRKQAHDRMVDIILLSKERGLSPEYRLIAKTYLNERFIEPFKVGPGGKPEPVEIIWDGIPNEAMRPINDIAREIYKEFRLSIGSYEQQVKETAHWVSNRGLVIKGEGPVTPQAMKAKETLESMDFKDGLEFKTQNDPTAPFVSVLGTVAPPARQNFNGERKFA